MSKIVGEVREKRNNEGIKIYNKKIWMQRRNQKFSIFFGFGAAT